MAHMAPSFGGDDQHVCHSFKNRSEQSSQVQASRARDWYGPENHQ